MPDSENIKPVGRVVGLWRYPVKSMAPEQQTVADVGWHGFAGDRRWAFIRSGVAQSGFPWLTLRERGNMNHYQPSFVDPTEPEKSATRVRAPSGVLFDITDPALAAELWPQGATVIRQNRGVFDTFPLSLITTRTISHLSECIGTPLEVQRFRPNILIEGADQKPFQEDDWLGHVIRIGGMSMRIDKRDGRCAVITIDPATTERDPAILRTVARDRQGCLGVYGSTVQPGVITVNDPVFIEASDG
jgi:uncharacterized protein